MNHVNKDKDGNITSVTYKDKGVIVTQKYDNRSASQKRADSFRERRASRSIAIQRTSLISKVLGVVLLLLLIALILRKTMGSGSLPTFTSFLKMLSESKTFRFNFSFSSYVFEFPSWLSWFQVYIDVVSSILDLLIFLVENIINCFIYLFYLINWFIA